MTGRRIEFPPDDAARFNALRDQWRGAAASLPLSRSAMRVATVLPTYVNREFGYAFPTDDDLRALLNASKETVKRGLADLEKADLIERETRIKRDANREAIGRERRIFLCFNDVSNSRPATKSEGSGGALKIEQTHQGEGSGRPLKSEETLRGEGSTPAEVKGQEVKGQPEVKGQKWGGEGSYGWPNIPDTNTRDLKIGSGDRKVSVYEKADPSPKPDPSPPPTVRSERTVDPSPTHRKVDARPLAPNLDAVPAAPNPIPAPGSWGDDVVFLATFDRHVVDMTAGREIGAGELERIIEQVFDMTTKGNLDFMPVYWADICAIRTGYDVAGWFRYRASAIVHQRKAA